MYHYSRRGKKLADRQSMTFRDLKKLMLNTLSFRVSASKTTTASEAHSVDGGVLNALAADLNMIFLMQLIKNRAL